LAFKAEYRLLTFFVIGASIFSRNFFYRSYNTYINSVAFFFWCFFLALAGVRMKIATKTMLELHKPHVPVCHKHWPFGGGTVMGLGVGFSGFRIDYFYFLFTFFMNGVWTSTEDMTIV
jgi:K(+)-stimulated pyrophosphate-energized sodium pump